MQIIQDRAVRHKKVEWFNIVLKASKVKYRIKKNGPGEKPGWKPVKLQGNDAWRVLRSKCYVVLIKGLYDGSDTCLPGDDGIRQENMLDVWSSWDTLFNLIDKPVLSDSDRKKLGPIISQFAVALVSLQGSRVLRSLYFHTVVCHTLSFVEACGSIGLYCNQGAESQNKDCRDCQAKIGHGGFGRNLTREEQAYSVQEALSMREAARSIPFCSKHDSFKCKCPFSERQAKWQPWARRCRVARQRFDLPPDQNATRSRMDVGLDAGDEQEEVDGEEEVADAGDGEEEVVDITPMTETLLRDMRLDVGDVACGDDSDGDVACGDDSDGEHSVDEEIEPLDYDVD